MDILEFIKAISQTDPYIKMIYLNGACYKFHLLLKKNFPGAEPFISPIKDHVITKYKGKYYDITGKVCRKRYTLMTKRDIDIASQWSFHRTRVIQISECPCCEEPIVI